MKKVLRYILLLFGCLLNNNKRSKILYYHDVYSKNSYKSLDSDVLMGTSIELFKKHIAVIKEEGFDIVPKITNYKNQVAIMFDDGFRGVWDNRKFFYDNGIRPTIFLAVDLIGKSGFLDKDEILELQKHGFNFQCHSWSHCDLTELSHAELKKELHESKTYLSNLLGKEVSEICLPIGFFSDSLIDELKECHYSEVYSSSWGCYDSLVLGFMRPRNLCQFATPYEVKLMLHGGHEILRNRDIKMHYKGNAKAVID